MLAFLTSMITFKTLEQDLTNTLSTYDEVAAAGEKFTFTFYDAPTTEGNLNQHSLFNLLIMSVIQIVLYCYQVVCPLRQQPENSVIESTIRFKHGEK